MRGRVAISLLFLGVVALAGDPKLRDLFDPLHPDFPLRRYGQDEWNRLSTDQRLREVGVDPSEWIDPPPEVYGSMGGGGMEPGFKLAERLQKKQAAFNRLLDNPGPTRLEGLIKRLRKIDRPADAYAKTVAKEIERYNRLRDAVAQHLAQQIKAILERTGKYPDGSQLTLPVALKQNFDRSLAAVRRHLSRQQSEREFHDWIPVRVAELVRALSDGERGRPLGALAGGLQASDWRHKVRCAGILGRIGGPGSAKVLHKAIATEKDPVALGQFIHAASWRAAPGFLELLKGRIDDPAWPVRAAVVRELARLKRKESVDLLIERLETEEGRLVDDLVRALHALTGKRIGADADLWRGWWKSARGAWKPPEKGAEEAGPEAAPKRGGVYFYGIQTRSKRIVFCIDISGSMLFRLDGDRLGGGTKEPRIDTARRELIKALENLPDDAVFNIVTYNAAVQVWKEGLVKATRRNKRAARLFVEGLEPVGSTNIFDALAKSLEIAGAARGKGKSPGADTIFFLTDGRPTSGQIVDPNQILAEITARNRLLGVTIHTIGVAREQNGAFLFNLAKRNHGEFASHK
jgi:hypothetical protein